MISMMWRTEQEEQAGSDNDDDDNADSLEFRGYLWFDVFIIQNIFQFCKNFLLNLWMFC